MRRESKKPPSMHRIPIVDADALQSALNAVYAQEGTHRKSARRLGIEATTFTRLLNGTVDAMNFYSYSAIVRSLGGHATEYGRAPDPMLEFVAKPSELDTERARRGRGVDREAEALAAGNLLDTFESSVLTQDSKFALGHYWTWVQRELRRLEKEAGPIFEELWAHPTYKRPFRDFLERVRGTFELPRPEDQRCRMALYRAVEPLYDSHATGGVERTWEEMDQARDLKAYLKVALKREEILMNRERDLVRIRRLPQDLLEWIKADLAGVFDKPDK